MRKKGKVSLPEFLRPYFWDVEFENLDREKHRHLIIKRLLDRGNLKEIEFVIKTYGKSGIREVVLSTRDLARPTGNFWADILDLDKNKIPCLQKPYDPIHWQLFS